MSDGSSFPEHCTEVVVFSPLIREPQLETETEPTVLMLSINLVLRFLLLGDVLFMIESLLLSACLVEVTTAELALDSS